MLLSHEECAGSYDISVEKVYEYDEKNWEEYFLPSIHQCWEVF